MLIAAAEDAIEAYIVFSCNRVGQLENSHDVLSRKPISKEFIILSGLTCPAVSKNGGEHYASFYSHEWHEKKSHE